MYNAFIKHLPNRLISIARKVHNTVDKYSQNNFESHKKCFCSSFPTEICLTEHLTPGLGVHVSSHQHNKSRLHTHQYKNSVCSILKSKIPFVILITKHLWHHFLYYLYV